MAGEKGDILRCRETIDSQEYTLQRSVIISLVVSRLRPKELIRFSVPGNVKWRITGTHIKEGCNLYHRYKEVA